MVNTCQVGHEIHDRLLVDTSLGQMYVYDVSKYNMNAGLYCSGQDAISDSLILAGSWEDRDTAVIRPILENGDRNKLVLDYGSHIGWYSIMASQLGYDVYAFDGDNENIELMQLTASLHDLDSITSHHLWIDENTPKLPIEQRDVELLKADIEGNEQHVINMVDEWLKKDKIKHLYLEITPVFNKSYPALIKKLRDYGYKIYFDDGREFDDDFNFGQINVLCKK